MWFAAETERRDEAAKNTKKKIHDRKVLKKRQFHSEKIRKFFLQNEIISADFREKDENKKTLT